MHPGDAQGHRLPTPASVAGAKCRIAVKYPNPFPFSVFGLPMVNRPFIACFPLLANRVRSVATCNVSSIAAKLCCPARCRIPMAISAIGTGSANLESAHSGPVVFSTILRKLLLCRGAMPKGQQPPWGKGCNREALRDGFTSGTWARSSLSAALRCRSWRYCARYGAPPGPCRMQSVTLVVKERRRCRCRPPSWSCPATLPMMHYLSAGCKLALRDM